MGSSLTRTDRSTMLAAAGVAVILIAQQVAGKATRDALFLSQFPAEELPKVMGGSAILAVVIVLIVSRLLTRWTPARAVPVLFAVNAVFFAAEWLLARTAPGAAGVVVYLHTAGLGAAVVSSFWSVVNEQFDPHTAKTAVSRIAIGATLGGIVGGITAWQLSAHVSVRSLLVALAVANAIVAVGVRVIVGKPGPTAPEQDTDNLPSGLTIIRTTPYLRLLTLLVALGALGETAIDYVFKAAAANAYSDGASLAAFFSLFHMTVGVATFGIQTTFAHRCLRRIGLAGTAATLPGLMLVGGIAALAAPLFWIITALRGAVSSLENSLFRSAYELTYTPLPPAKKRPTKTIIDVGGDKLAAALGSGVALLVVVTLPVHADRVLLGFACVAAACALIFASLLHRGYISALADALRSGAIELDEKDMMDATTRRTFADTTALDRKKLLAEIAALRESSARATQPPSDSVPEKFDPNVNPLETFRSGNTRQIRDVLANCETLDPELIPDAIALLTRDSILSEVVHRLRASAGVATNLLIAALLDPGSDVTVRRRIPRVLRAIPTQEVVDGLVRALSDDQFEVRYRSSVALLRLTSQADELNVPEQKVFPAVRRELALDLQVRDGHALADDDGGEDSPFGDDALANNVGRSLSYIFTLLALVLDREPLYLAFCSLASDNRSLRGTGLEYLDSVLPADLRDALAPYFADQELAKRAARPRHQIVAELLDSRDTLALDRKQLLDMIKRPQ